MDDPKTVELKVGDIVRALYKVLDVKGNVVDCLWVQGVVINIDHEFGNAYPYDVRFNFEGRTKVSPFKRGELEFYDRVNKLEPKEQRDGAKVITITEVSSEYITWPEDWIDDQQF